MKNQNYKKLAKNLHAANFRMYGVGNFDINQEEVSEILESIFNNPKNLQSIYERLEKKRMG